MQGSLHPRNTYGSNRKQPKWIAYVIAVIVTIALFLFWVDSFGMDIKKVTFKSITITLSDTITKSENCEHKKGRVIMDSRYNPDRWSYRSCGLYARNTPDVNKREAARINRAAL